MLENSSPRLVDPVSSLTTSLFKTASQTALSDDNEITILCRDFVTRVDEQGRLGKSNHDDTATLDLKSEANKR